MYSVYHRPKKQYLTFFTLSPKLIGSLFGFDIDQNKKKTKTKQVNQPNCVGNYL